MFEGTEIKFGAGKKIAPPLSLGQIKRFAPQIKDMNIGALDAETVDLSVTLIHAALSRNYPEITTQEVEDNIDISQMAPAITAIMRISGFEENQPGKQGEGKK